LEVVRFGDVYHPREVVHLVMVNRVVATPTMSFALRWAWTPASVRPARSRSSLPYTWELPTVLGRS